MISVLRYQRLGVDLQWLREQLLYIKKHYVCVLPGDPLVHNRLAVLLTFDDAIFNFYHSVYPILKACNMRALLAVPTHYIVQSTQVAAEKRLAVPYTLRMQEPICYECASFCTYEELKEMALSSHVQLACHSHLHTNLTFDFVDRTRELKLSKELIEEHVGQMVNAFIYPFGQFNGALHAEVLRHYPYIFGNSFGINRGWSCQKTALRRIPGDCPTRPTHPFSLAQRASQLFSTFL